MRLTLHAAAADAPFSADAWRGSDQGSLVALALSRKPSLFAAESASSESSVATAAAAKQTARVNEVVAQMERYNTMLQNAALKLPDGGANVRATPCRAARQCADMCASPQLRIKRDALAAELAELRGASSTEAAQSQQSQGSESDLADMLRAISM